LPDSRTNLNNSICEIWEISDGLSFADQKMSVMAQPLEGLLHMGIADLKNNRGDLNAAIGRNWL
jgi:hypothetical protein